MGRAIALALAGVVGVAMAGAMAAERRSGFEFMGPGTQAMQRDDIANPGMLWVLEGEALWSRADGAGGASCATCHGAAETSMRGVAARYPAWDAEHARPIDLQGRIAQCRTERQKATPLMSESPELLGLSSYVANQSRGMPVTPDPEARLTPFRERGAALFNQRIGQLNLSCASCHDDNAGRRLGGAPIPEAHPTGYPLYRLEWQGLGSLQRRLRNCMTGVRAEAYGFGAPEWVELELFLMSRAQGMAVETPAVRP